MVDNKYKIIEGLHRLDDYFKDEDDFIHALENDGYFYADEKNVTDEKVYKVITKDMSRFIGGEYIKLLIKKDILGDCDIIYGEDEDSNEFDTVGIEDLFFEPNSNKDFLELSNDAFYCLLSFDEDYIGDMVDNLFW